MFVLRQINNKINTTVVSMSVICLMLFMTITILSSSLSLRDTMQKDLIEMTPVDINLYKTANLPEKTINNYTGKEIIYTKEQIEDSRVTIQETLKNNGLDMNVLKDIVEISTYTDSDLTWAKFFENNINEVKSQFPMLAYNTAEVIVKISDYKKIARLYGLEQYELNDDEYIVLCDFDSMKQIRDKVLMNGNTLQIAGKEYHSKYNECKNGFVFMSTSHVNTGIILVPDSCPLTEDMKERQILVANYNVETEEEKEKIEECFIKEE